MSLLIHSLTAGYGNKYILKNMSLDAIAPGTLLAVLGANGAGKSTLLKTLAGLLPYQGEIQLDGQSLKQLSHQQRIQHFAYLPQALPQSSSLLAYEMIYSACRATVAWSTEAIEKRIEVLFKALDIESLALKKMNTLSGGQRQMVGLLQVLVRKPKVLLLDEPTSALDLRWQLRVLQAIGHEAAQSQSIALVACHDVNLALRFCDQILLLAPEKLLAMGKAKEVLTPEHLRIAYNIEGRIESCSQGYPIVLADSAVV